MIMVEANGRRNSGRVLGIQLLTCCGGRQAALIIKSA
jgi:hypothetical protein